MSPLKETIIEDIKSSMKAHELERVKVLRHVQSVIKQIELDRQTQLDDSGVIDILQKQLKQRQESLAIFEANGRDDLAQKEQFEIDIITQFMPEKMSDAALAALVNSEIATQNASSMQDMGKVMSALKTKTAGRADPALISQLVKKALQG